MKLTKRFIVLFLSVTLANISTLDAMSMGMKPMPMSMKSKELLCAVAEKKRMDEREKRRRVKEWENKFINELLTSKVNLNNDTNIGKPLEVVARFKSIKTLLRHGADPKLCQKSPLIRPILYYLDRDEELPVFSWQSKEYYEKCQKDHQRRSRKALACLVSLLKSGADINQENFGMLPLQSIVALNKCYFTNHFLKLLIWQGANPKKIESRTKYSACDYAVNRRREYYNCFKQERQKYEAVCQLLAGHKEKDSPLSLLPKEILKEIRILIWYGVPFDPPPEKKIMPSKVEPDIEPITSVSTAADISQESKQISNGLETNLETHIEEPETMVSTRSTIFVLRRMPIPIIIVGVVASGISYWLYTKWQERKKVCRKQLQAKWEGFQQKTCRGLDKSQV